MALAETLASIDILAALPARARERLTAQAHHLTLAAGETSDALAEAGAVLFLISGSIRVSHGEDGRIAFVDIAAGQAAGLAEAVAGTPPGARAILVLEAAEAVILPGAPLLAALQASAAASFALARRFAAQLTAAAPIDDPLQRVFRDLLHATRPLGDARWTVDPLPRHREIASRAGVAEGEAAMAIAHLVRLGVARRRYPALDIEDRDALKALAG